MGARKQASHNPIKRAASRLLSLVGKAGIRLAYGATEGMAFLATPQGLKVVVAVDQVALALRHGISAPVVALLGSFLACGVAKGGWVAATSKPKQSDDAIWSWEPPAGTLQSEAYNIMKEMSATLKQMEKDYPELRFAVSRQLSPYSFITRLYYLYCNQKQYRHTDKDIKDRGCPDVDQETMDKIRFYRYFSLQTYTAQHEAQLSKGLREKGFQLICCKMDVSWSDHAPAFYLAINQERREVLMAIRGTNSPADMATDLVAQGEEYRCGDERYRAHSGMVQATHWMSDRFTSVLTALAKEGYSVTLVGHSLGAAVCALLSCQLKCGGVDDVHCYALEPPACMDPRLAEWCEDMVTSVVLCDDMVPRMSAERFAAFLAFLSGLDEGEKEVEEDHPMATAVLRFISDRIEDNMPDDQEKARKETGSQGKTIRDVDISGYNPHVPGRVIYIYRVKDGEGRKAYRHAVVPRDFDELNKFLVTCYTLSDHFIDTEEYERAVQGGVMEQ